MGSRRLLGLACVAGFTTLFVGAQLAAKGAAEDWPQFRGANRDGVSTETGLLQSWPEAGPPEAWRMPLGDGYSSVSIVGNRLYTMFAGDHEGQPTEFAAAFDASTGKELWRTPLAERYDNSFGNGPRSTPAVDGSTVYALSSRGDLAALATKDGKERWRLNFTEAFGAEIPTFGFSTSMLVDGDQVFVEGAGPDGKAYAALDKRTGEVKWTFGDTGDGGAGYNSPLLVNLGGGECYVYVLNSDLKCVTQKGEEAWAFPWPGPGETHGMPVLVPPNKVFASGTEGIGAFMLAVNGSGDKSTVDQVWQTRHMRNHFSSSLLHEGTIYGFDNATLRAISAETGETAWAKRGFGKGSLIFADGHLIVLSDRGVLALVEATPEAFNEKGRVQALEGRCWTAPSFSNGRLYLRNHDEMVSYDLRK